jgi:hypothetical protein
MRFEYMAVVFLLLIHPTSFQVSPEHDTVSENRPESRKVYADTQSDTAPPTANNESENPPIPNYRTQPQQYESSREYKWGLTKAELIMAVLTGFYVCLTLAYVIVSGCMLRALKEQSRTARIAAIAAKRSADSARQSSEFTQRTIKDSERAQVYLESAQLRFSTSGKFDNHSWLVLTIKNFGRTRAINVNGDFKFEDVPLVDTAKSVQTVHTILGAGQEHSITFDRFVHLLDGPTFQKIMRGEQQLRYVGWFTYDDIFRNRHTTQCAGPFDNQTASFTIDENRAG